MSRWQRWRVEYYCALLASAALLPGAAALLSSALYLDRHRLFLNGTGSRSLGAGIGLAVLAWLVLSPLLRRFAYPARAIPTVYDELHTEYDELLSLSQALAPEDRATAAGVTAARHLEKVRDELGFAGAGQRPNPSLRWTLAAGYLATRERLHRAREMLVELVPAPQAAERAMEARARLRGSKIADAQGLTQELELAIASLDPALLPYLEADRPPRAAVAAAAPQTAEPPTAPPASISTADATAARLTVRRIMRVINEYRDSRRDGIVRSRNRLFATILFAGFTAYAVLALALVEEVARRWIAAGVAYYLIGAVVGLFQQLRAASAADTVTEEDYGLATARLINTPLFSGIAAVGGVALAVLAPLAAPGSRQGTAKLEQVFDLANYPAGVVIAAVFGLTPTLLITRLQRQTEQYKADLRGSEAGEKSGGTTQSSA
jgi:hypothetical protein